MKKADKASAIFMVAVSQGQYRNSTINWGQKSYLLVTKSSQVTSSHIESSQVKLSSFKLSQVESRQKKLSQVELSQVESSWVKYKFIFDTSWQVCWAFHIFLLYVVREHAAMLYDGQR